LSEAQGILRWKPSSIDDRSGEEAPMANGRPWWMDDPEIIALTERTLAEIENADDLPTTDDPDPVLAEFYSGEISRELSAIRDESEALRMRHRQAVLAAREAGLSWTEIGRLLGVSRQQVHRKFGALP
jgi:DNA-directed RNA polymerase specialized sigma24 family protein